MPASTNPSQAIDLAVLIGLTVGLGLGGSTLTVWLIGFMTGWRKLAAQFPARAPLPGAAAAFGSVGFYALGNYNNCVRFRMDEECLHIGLIPPFSWTHPPMSVPWAAVEIVEADARGSLLSGWGFSRLRVAGVPVRVPRKVIARELELRAQLDTLRHPQGQIAARSS
jgi:hypothetical protein